MLLPGVFLGNRGRRFESSGPHQQHSTIGCQPPFNLVFAGYPVADLIVVAPWNVLFREENPQKSRFYRDFAA